MPIILSHANAATYKEIGKEIAKAIKDLSKEAIILASSDMTHYEPQESVKEKDSKAIEAILDLNENELLKRVDELNISIKTVLFSVYQCKNEIGINGIEFEKTVDAERCEAILKSLESDTLRFNVFRNKNVVIHLWRDDVTDSCFYKFRELILEKLNIEN